MSEFLDKLVEKTKNMKIGDPFLDETTVGSMISKDQADRVLSYVEGAKKDVSKSIDEALSAKMRY